MEIKLNEFVDIVGMADPASGKLTKEGCQSAIVIVGQLDDGRAFVLDEWAERCDTTILTRQIFVSNKKWHCHRFGIDATGQQNLYFQMVQREANIRRERIALVPREMPTTEAKEFRITTTIQRWMHNGLLFVNEDCKGTLKQLTAYPHNAGGLCDLVDALTEALRMLHDPLAGRGKLTFDPEYDEEERFRKALRGDSGPQYAGIARRN